MKKVNLILLKKLRQTTWISFEMCKQALLANDNDFEKSLQWLKVQGITKGIKKAERVSNQGVYQALSQGNKAVLLSLTCETDFVAKNHQFLDFFHKLGKFVFKQNILDSVQLLQKHWKDGSVGEAILELSGLLGEKITLKECFVVQKDSNQVFATYNHSNNQICSLLVLNKDTPIKEDLAMHVVAFEPRFIALTDIPQSVIDQEKQVVLEQVAKTISPNKPTVIREKMIAGKLHKTLQDICLLEQKFVKIPQQTVKSVLVAQNLQIEKMYIRKIGG